MRKAVIEMEKRADSESWLELGEIARVEFTSEDDSFKIESALVPGTCMGWRSAQPGEQSIRLRFDVPQHIRRIRLEFAEERFERVQEFVLRWLAEGESAYREVVRQQFVFSPGGATSELEDYEVDLKRAVALELRINPDFCRRPHVFASLQRLQLA